jgi:hypothetical protein
MLIIALLIATYMLYFVVVRYLLPRHLQTRLIARLDKWEQWANDARERLRK